MEEDAKPVKKPADTKAENWTLEQAREMGRRGGLARTERKRIANQINAFKRKKCINCTLSCPFKEQLLTKDIDNTCQVPAHIKGLMSLNTKEAYLAELEKMLTVFRSQAGNSNREIKDAYYMLLSMKKEFMPETQVIETKNLHAVMTVEQLSEIIKEKIKENNGR